MAIDARLGQVLRNRYEIIELVGEGGMARVYRGVDRRLSRPIVLKILRAELVDNAEFRERFSREASNAARLAHSNIIKVYDVDEEDGTPFIVMEYYPAQDLKSILRKVGKLSASRAVAIASDILDALDYAHSQGIVHRDLKPHNVLITDRNEVKITDFGIAKALGGESLTRTGTMIGTAHYMSPEQAEGKDVGPQTDIYSLGIMLYEMLCGRLPFEGDNAVTVAVKHVQEAPQPLSSRGTAVAPGLEDAVMTAIRKSPADRFRDAQTFRRALQTVSATLDSRPPNGFSRRPPDGLDETLMRPAIPSTRGEQGPPIPAWSLADSGEFRPVPPTPPPAPVEPGPSGARTAVIWLLWILCLAGMGYAAWLIFYPQPAVAVPAIVGMKEDQARREVEKAGLRFTIKEFVYSNEEPGIVKSQSPAAGIGLKRGNEVLVVISKGRQTVQVPGLNGLDRQAARQAIEERGLTVKWLEDFNESIPVGQVAAQEPPPGTQVDLKTTVTVTVSKGVQKVVIPKLVGMVEKDAGARAEAGGFKMRTLTEKASASVPKGQVMEQTPKAGTKVPKGATIEVILSSGPEMRSVPTVETMTLEQARKAAQQQGFRLVVEGGGGAPEQRILSQDPLGGASVPQGTTITVKLEPLPTPEVTPTPADETVMVPNVVRMQDSDVQAVLEEHGLSRGSSSTEESDAPRGTVVRQSPEAGASVHRGTPVKIWVAKPKSDGNQDK